MSSCCFAQKTTKTTSLSMLPARGCGCLLPPSRLLGSSIIQDEDIEDLDHARLVGDYELKLLFEAGDDEEDDDQDDGQDAKGPVS